MLHQTTNTNTLHGDHMIEIMKASTFQTTDEDSDDEMNI
jgi:hypothetical protein